MPVTVRSAGLLPVARRPARDRDPPQPKRRRSSGHAIPPRKRRKIPRTIDVIEIDSSPCPSPPRISKFKVINLVSDDEDDHHPGPSNLEDEEHAVSTQLTDPTPTKPRSSTHVSPSDIEQVLRQGQETIETIQHLLPPELQPMWNPRKPIARKRSSPQPSSCPATPKPSSPSTTGHDTPPSTPTKLESPRVCMKPVSSPQRKWVRQKEVLNMGCHHSLWSPRLVREETLEDGEEEEIDQLVDDAKSAQSPVVEQQGGMDVCKDKPPIMQNSGMDVESTFTLNPSPSPPKRRQSSVHWNNFFSAVEDLYRRHQSTSASPSRPPDSSNTVLPPPQSVSPLLSNYTSSSSDSVDPAMVKTPPPTRQDTIKDITEQETNFWVVSDADDDSEIDFSDMVLNYPQAG